MHIEVKQVKRKSDMRRFIRFYTNLYKNNSCVAFPPHLDESDTLNKQKNPAMAHCSAEYWIAYSNGKVVGRIAAIINYLECIKLNKSIGRIGWFDFIDDKSVSEALINRATEWLKSNNIDTVHGPLGFTDLDKQGSLIDGFNEQGTYATNYNFEYYKDHYENIGFTKSTDWVEFELKISDQGLNKMNRISEFVKHKYNVHAIEAKSKSAIKDYAPGIFQLMNECYKDLYGYIPLNTDQMEKYTKMFIGLINPELIGLVADSNNKLIGFGISMPSFTEAARKARGKLIPTGWIHFLKALKKNDTLDLYLLAVAPGYQNKGVNSIIMSQIVNNAIKFGITKAETNIELEDNSKVQDMWKFFDSRMHKRRRCYIKSI